MRFPIPSTLGLHHSRTTGVRQRGGALSAAHSPPLSPRSAAHGSWLPATPLLPSFSSFSLFWLKCRLGSSEPELCIFRIGQTAPRGHCVALRPPHQQGWEDVLLEGRWKLCSRGWTSRPLGGHVAPASFPLPGHCVLALKGCRMMQVPKCRKPPML